MHLYRWLEQAVKTRGGARALIYRDTYLSWRGLKHRVDRRAAELRSAGVRPGDCVGLMLGNVPDVVILSLALAKLGAVPVPLDPTTSTQELSTIMGLVPIRGFITRPRGGDAPLPSRVPTRAGGSAPVKPRTRKRLQGTLLTCAIYDSDARPPHGDEERRTALVVVTADSGGEPKLVERTEANVEAEATNVGQALGLDGEDRVLLTLPLYHSYALDIGLLAALRHGAGVYLEDEVAPVRTVKLVREQQITLVLCTPQMLEDLARLPAVRPPSEGRLRYLSAGGGLTGAALEAFRKTCGVRPQACYHTSETGTVAIDPDGKHGDTVGRVLDGVEVRILNGRTGRPAASGRKGQLWVRGRGVSPLALCGGVAAADEQAGVGSTSTDGWYRTGYLATLDRARRLRLQGREDDVVVLDGKRVVLGEVEGCIREYPAVQNAKARLITDPLGGPMVVARVVLDGEAAGVPEAIIDFCSKNLSPYKVPRRIEVCENL